MSFLEIDVSGQKGMLFRTETEKRTECEIKEKSTSSESGLRTKLRTDPLIIEKGSVGRARLENKVTD